MNLKMNDFKTLMANLLRARFAYIYVPTWEEERALDTIRAIAQDEALIKTCRQVFTWSLTDGLTPKEYIGREEIKTPMKALEFIEKYEESALFVLKDFHTYFGTATHAPDAQIVRKL